MDQLFERLSIGYPHPDTHEYVLTYAEVLCALSHIGSHLDTVILGGDVLDDEDHHTYMNWYYQRNETLTMAKNARLSCDQAMQYITNLPNPQLYRYILVLN